MEESDGRGRIGAAFVDRPRKTAAWIQEKKGGREGRRANTRVKGANHVWDEENAAATGEKGKKAAAIFKLAKWVSGGH
ncbi:hypothetical protein CCHR01_04870 [Colletotrichum chrysophilum]|uniref:Uncharacterized protein n=1 Tax=Colletotrichum chrysophilum TaxID=1836956 RepID=A0AAD9AQE5_9PEZI|nr:hypothetical protein CCHR01_04870 [Colletotrichum chrysophilum]